MQELIVKTHQNAVTQIWPSGIWHLSLYVRRQSRHDVLHYLEEKSFLKELMEMNCRDDFSSGSGLKLHLGYDVPYRSGSWSVTSSF